MSSICRMRLSLATVGLALLATAILQVPVRADTVDVSIPGFSFSPASLTIIVGQTVRWTNNHTVPHTATSDSGGFGSGTLNPGQKFSFTFNIAGGFPYHCTIHPSMKATITVNSPSCCVLGGDASNNGTVNILDVAFLINYLYKGGPAPACQAQADADNNGSINILDVSPLITYLYTGGSAPTCPPA